MKKIVCRIEGDKVVIKETNVSDEDLSAINLTLKPAWQNWDSLRKEGWQTANLKRHEKEPDYLTFWKGEILQEEVEIEMANHDWWCSMSDDYSVAAAGERHFRKITEMCKQLPIGIVEWLWKQYAPKEWAWSDYAKGMQK